MMICRARICPCCNSMPVELLKQKQKTKTIKSKYHWCKVWSCFVVVVVVVVVFVCVCFFLSWEHVFSFFLKLFFEIHSLRETGRLFHSLAAALENVLTSKRWFFFWGGVCSSCSCLFVSLVNLNLWKVSASQEQHLLTQDQKKKKVLCSKELLRMVEHGGWTWLCRVVKGANVVISSHDPNKRPAPIWVTEKIT